jgi:hypothetical protein
MPFLPKPRSALSPAILTVRRHWLPVTTCKRAVVIPYITDAPVDIAEGCPLFPSVGNTADGYQGAVFHSYVGAACAIGSLRHRLGMGGLREHRGGDQERNKRTKRDLEADTDVPAPRTAKIVGARKDEAQSPQPKSNFHQNLRSVPGGLAPIHHSRQRNGGDRLGNYSVLSELRIRKVVFCSLAAQPAGRNGYQINRSRIIAISASHFEIF